MRMNLDGEQSPFAKPRRRRTELGNLQRGAHVVDPHTGIPPSGLLSVTVVGPDLATADAFATAAFAMGADGPAWTTTLTGYDAMCVTSDHRVLLTPGFARHRV
jgi:thiamine biosynthesis lipoprotein